MDLAKYEELTGTTVSSQDIERVEANIAKTQTLLEKLLGFTLNPNLRNNNQYEEMGKTKSECPNPEDINLDNLDDPDAIVFAYRLYNYNPKDKYFSIDPATEVHKVKLIKDGVTLKTLTASEYRVHFKQGFSKYLEQIKTWCSASWDCEFVQLAVDAEWLFEELPNDLNHVWAEMITYYSDIKKDIKSQTLGTHRYEKFSDNPPEKEDTNFAIIQKYAGPHGSIKKIITA